MEEKEGELTFSEELLIELVEHSRKTRQYTGFLAGVLLGYMAIAALLFLLNIVSVST